MMMGFHNPYLQTFKLKNLLLSLFFFVSTCPNYSHAIFFTWPNECLLSLVGEVAVENYTYYHLSHSGSFVIHVRSIQGDADIYVAENNLNPTYSLDSHDVKSATCGHDYVYIPATFKRPVGIGIYGYKESRYELCFVMGDDYVYDDYVSDLDSEQSNGYDEDFMSGSSRTHPHIPPVPTNEKESLLWNLFLDVIRVLMEFLL